MRLKKSFRSFEFETHYILKKISHVFKQPEYQNDSSRRLLLANFSCRW